MDGSTGAGGEGGAGGESPCGNGACPEPRCDDGTLNGAETDADCGGNCEPCLATEHCVVAPDCVSDVCAADGTCAEPTCSDGVRNGTELSADCGGPVCDPCPAGPCLVGADCVSGRCDPATHLCVVVGPLVCARGSSDCDGDPTNACETNVLTSDANCGACGRQCNLANADSSCVNGECVIAQCRGSFQNCSTSDADGCRTDVDNDPLNCGSCGEQCSTLNGAARCETGTCKLTCDAGYADCDGDVSNGCEATLEDVNNCGGCGKTCPGSGGVPSCAGGKCRVDPCASGLGACAGDGKCNYDLQDDPENCGRCGHACLTMNGVDECIDGVCDLTACEADFGDCDGRRDNGCETALVDASNCGACGNVCPSDAPTCVNAGGVNRCQATVSYVNYARDISYNATLSFDHTLLPGAERLLLAAVVVESLNGTSIDAARPLAVHYGPVTMTPLASQASGSPGEYNPYIYYYTLTESDLPANGQPLTVTPATTPVGIITGNLIEFSGVDQVNPIVLGTGATLTVPMHACNATAPITTTEPGTALFVVAVADLAGFGEAIGSELVTPPFWGQGLIGTNGFYVFGALGGTDGTVLPPDTYTIGFGFQWCDPAAVLPIGIVPYHLE